MAYNTKEKQRAYYEKNRERNRVRRRKYFREYSRKTKDRRKLMYMLEGVDKIMISNKELSDSIIGKTELLRREQMKLDIKMDQIKRFINLK